MWNTKTANRSLYGTIQTRTGRGSRLLIQEQLHALKQKKEDRRDGRFIYTVFARLESRLLPSRAFGMIQEDLQASGL